eukprot:3939713-Rhodomonas_salina.2
MVKGNRLDDAAQRPPASEQGGEESTQADTRKSASTLGKKSKRKLSAKGSVVVDVANCHYEPVRTVAKEKGWKLLEESDLLDRSKMRFNLFWSDRSVTRTRIRSLGPHQMANHFPGMLALSSKAQLAQNLGKMKELFPNDFSFFPKTWTLPDEYAEFMQEIQKHKASAKQSSEPFFIVKPDRGCQGQICFLPRNFLRALLDVRH